MLIYSSNEPRCTYYYTTMVLYINAQKVKKNNFYFFRILKRRKCIHFRRFKIFVFRKSKKKYFLGQDMYILYRPWCVV